MEKPDPTWLFHTMETRADQPYQGRSSGMRT